MTVPGSKSQTNRALVLSALAAATGQGISTIRERCAAATPT
ncbi:EPSP synthase family protein [Mycobacterium xenopi 3993]|nr:EPSP synthase family protein [Mycobacterium xenopi 3993]